MTGQTLYTNHLIKILDGEQIAVELAVILFNAAKVITEQERPWRFLLKEDSSQTRSSGDTYLTMKTLVSDFNFDVGMLVGSSTLEYEPIGFEERRKYQNSGRHYYIDIGNSQFAITGQASQTETIFMQYTMFTTDLTVLADSFSSGWPVRFLPLIAFNAAAIYRGGTDFDDQNARMSVENRAVARALKDSMVSWDARLKLRSMGNSTRPVRTSIPLGSKNVDIR